MNIFIGNLSFETRDEGLREAFSTYGAVDRAQVAMDRESGRSRGFGFVEMPNEDEGRKAISALNGSDLAGRSLTVNEARPKAPRGDFAGGNGGGGGRGRRW
jgi:RNA recognition motif-containing protein